MSQNEYCFNFDKSRLKGRVPGLFSRFLWVIMSSESNTAVTRNEIKYVHSRNYKFSLVDVLHCPCFLP